MTGVFTFTFQRSFKDLVVEANIANAREYHLCGLRT
jgi:hypothetical protein